MSLLRHFDVEKIAIYIGENLIDFSSDDYDISVLDGEIFMVIRWPDNISPNQIGILKFDPFLEYLQFNVNDELHVFGTLASSVDQNQQFIEFRNYWLENGQQLLTIQTENKGNYNVILYSRGMIKYLINIYYNIFKPLVNHKK